jgi:hypothetical protein
MEQFLKKRVTLHERAPVVPNSVVTTERLELNQGLTDVNQADSDFEFEFEGEKPAAPVKQILG